MEIRLDFNHDAATDDPAGDVQGWQYGICHDPGLLSITSVCGGADTIALRECEGPDYFEKNVCDRGATVGLVVDFMQVISIDRSIRDWFDLLITYDAHGIDMGCHSTNDGVVTHIFPCDDLGSPEVACMMVVGGTAIRLGPGCYDAAQIAIACQGECSPVPVCPVCAPPALPFLRGMINGDDTVNIADSIFLLSYLFAGDEEPLCHKAADCNDDGRLDIADAIKLLGHLFGGEGGLPPPFSACDADPTQDALTCEAFPWCE
jgi:hypothetical protein